MSDETVVPENGGEQTGFTPPATQEELNALIAKRLERERAKFADYDDAKQKAARLDELELANKSDLERIQAQLAEQEQARTAAESELIQLRVAAKFGIQESDLDLLGTGSEEVLTARAERIKALTETSNTGRRELHVPGEGNSPDLALNSPGIEDALKRALGAA